MMLESLWIAFLSILILIIAWKILRIQHVIVYEYQKGLRYRKGRFVRTLEPGQYWFLATFSSIVPVDVRPEFITIQGQDVLSADGVTLKVSLAAELQVVDPNVAVNKHADFRGNMYLTLQMLLREIVGQERIETLLENRASIGKRLVETASPKAGTMGLKLISADVKDIMFPGEMKKVFAQVVKAQKEGQAALERARGEAAALRNLANAARAVDENPNLLQLRALQALSESSGSTLVLGLPNGAAPIARKKSNEQSKPREGEDEDRDA